MPIGRIILRGYEAENKQLKLVTLATAGRPAETLSPTTSRYLGYMPLNGQYGIIFMAATAPKGNYEREAAHELGHGAFGLELAWKVYPLNQNSTPNLMDYNNGTELWAGQWKYMHEWHMKLGVGQKVEDGAYLDENCFSSDVNYQIFKTYYMPLKKFPAFHSSFGYNKKHTNVSYCFSELDAKLYSFIKVN